MHTLRFCFCYFNSILQNNTYFYERRVVERKKQKAATKKTWASKEIAKEESNRNCKCHFSFDRFYCGLLDHFICWFSFASSCFSFGLLTASEADLQCEFSFWYCSSFVLCKTTRQYIMLFDAIASALLLRLLYIYIYKYMCVWVCVCVVVYYWCLFSPIYTRGLLSTRKAHNEQAVFDYNLLFPCFSKKGKLCGFFKHFAFFGPFVPDACIKNWKKTVDQKRFSPKCSQKLWQI